MKTVDLDKEVELTEPPIRSEPIKEGSVPDTPTVEVETDDTDETAVSDTGVAVAEPAWSRFLGEKLSKWTSRSLIAWVGASYLLVVGHLDQQYWAYVTIMMIAGTKSLDIVQAVWTKK